MTEITFSCIIPASKKDSESQMLRELIDSIRSQDYPQDEIEIIIVTEGDSESAKAIGIRKARGKYCAMFCADNCVTDKNLFRIVKNLIESDDYIVGVYSKFYEIVKSDNSLNRYFSLIGNNDPIAYYLGKSDRRPCFETDENELYTLYSFKDKVPSLGDNGFFYRREYLLESNLDNYYPMDNAEDLRRLGMNTYLRYNFSMIWHRTSENLFTFLRKRYRYARDLYCDRTDRRWRMVETNDDIRRLCWFVIASLLVVPCLLVSIRGFSKVKDPAWFWHWPVCFGFLITYTILAIRNLFKYGQLFQRRN